MKNDGKFLIYVNKNIYWDLSLIPEKNEYGEHVNRCALIDSIKKEEITSINFDSEWLIPIFQCRSKIGMQELAKKLKEIADKHGISMVPSSQMPEDKRIKITKHIGKARKL